MVETGAAEILWSLSWEYCVTAARGKVSLVLISTSQRIRNKRQVRWYYSLLEQLLLPWVSWVFPGELVHVNQKLAYPQTQKEGVSSGSCQFNPAVMWNGIWWLLLLFLINAYQSSALMWRWRDRLSLTSISERISKDRLFCVVLKTVLHLWGPRCLYCKTLLSRVSKTSLWGFRALKFFYPGCQSFCWSTLVKTSHECARSPFHHYRKLSVLCLWESEEVCSSPAN